VFPAVDNQRYHAELLDEGLEPHTVHHISLCGTNSPNYEVDISDVLDVKLEAILCHESQIATSLAPGGVKRSPHISAQKSHRAPLPPGKPCAFQRICADLQTAYTRKKLDEDRMLSHWMGHSFNKDYSHNEPT
jgi:hypothetical protein